MIAGRRLVPPPRKVGSPFFGLKCFVAACGCLWLFVAACGCFKQTAGDIHIQNQKTKSCDHSLLVGIGL